MKVSLSAKSMASIVAMSIFLAGCGGGSDGGSDSGTTKPPVKPPVVVPPVKPPVVVPPVDPVEPPVEPTDPVLPPITTPDDEEVQADKVPNTQIATASLLASNLISTQRQACGLGGLQHDEELAKISNNHAQYLAHLYSNANISINSHREAGYVGYESVSGSGNPYFTGLTAKDRIIAAGYKIEYDMAENISESTKFNLGGLITSPETAAKGFVSGLLSAPYHLQSLMEPARKLTGTSFFAYLPHNGNPKMQKGYVLVNTAANGPASDASLVKGVFTYPCEGVVGTSTALWNESPNPVQGTGRNLATDPIGQPIYIYDPSATSIKVSNIKVRDVVRKIDVPVSLLDYSSDPHIGTAAELPKNKAFILPLTDSLETCNKGYNVKNCGLYGNSEYQVSFDILSDNKTLASKSFKFKTGNTNLQ